MTTVDIAGLVVEYRRGDYPVRPLDGFTARVDSGRLAVLLGPSGCGKTTLLSCLAGIQRPTSGTITVGGHDVTSMNAGALTDYRRSTVGVVFQAFNLVPSLSARENVMVPLRAAGRSGRAARARADELLEMVGLGERGAHRPGELSGGQMQRVAIARALALEPPLVVADEPTANLDHVQVEVVLRLLRNLTSTGRTVIVSTHDHRLVPLADVVIDMSREAPSDLSPTVTRSLADGEVLFEERQPGNRVYRVDSGEIVISRQGEPAGSCRAGDVFGEMAPLFAIPRTATAHASGPTVVTGFTVEAFTQEFGGDELRRLVGRWGGE